VIEVIYRQMKPGEQLLRLHRTNAALEQVLHLLHGVALTALGLSGMRQPVVTWAWLIGVILFSGSIYGLCLLENAKWLGPVTPLGGLSMMIGWLVLAIKLPQRER